MRKLVLLSFFLCSYYMLAQQVLSLHFSGDSIKTYQLWKIDSITFDEDSIGDYAIADSVDLGLSVKWASWNIGANDIYQKGFLFGWGNKYSGNHSTQLKYFPSASYNSNIVDTDYDIAKSLWHGSWRMPTKEEVKELKENCKWTFDQEHNGYIVTNKSDSTKFIFLPLTGYNYAEDSVSLDKGFYWTGEISKYNNEDAYALITSQDNFDVDSLLRSYRMAVRPVHGQYKRPIEIKSSVIVKNNVSYIKTTLKGEGENIVCGYCYGKNKDINIDNYEDYGEEEIGELKDNIEKTFTVSGLDYATKYYYITYVKVDNEYTTTPVDSFVISTMYPVGRIVDLGLGVKWSDMNMGADTESDKGIYINWSDADYDGSYEIPSDTIIKGNPTYDIASNIWKDEWRMPSKAEWQELFDKCTKKYVEVNGNPGVRFIGLSGDSIFIPATSYYEVNNLISSYRNYCYYWSAEFNKGKNMPYYATFTKNQMNLFNSPLTNRMCVRPVYGEYNAENIIDPTVKPDTPDTPDPGQTEDPDKPTGEDEPSDTPEETDEGSKLTQVDLGLSVYWSNCNLGANSETEYGDYYAWGDTVVAERYSQNDYTYYDPEIGGYINISSSVNISNSLYDVATHKLGGKWHIPTRNQLIELQDECDWIFTEISGVKGYKVKSKTNDNFIFLPFAGRKMDADLFYENTRGMYWSSTAEPSDKDKITKAYTSAYYLQLIENKVNGSSVYERFYGLSIRPVCDK